MDVRGLCWGGEMKRMKVLSAVAGLVLTLAAAESGVRLLGLTDFPLYIVDNEQGYIPAPQQSGSFMNRNRWHFNDKSMGIDRPFAPTQSTDVLLIGDSIVLGGNSMDHSVKLGPVLSERRGRMHWPISAGSWALLNEIRYLQRHPEVLDQVGELEFVLNSADFGEASSWACETTHPRERPAFALKYLIQKYVIKREPCGVTPSGLKVRPSDWQAELGQVLNSPAVRGKRVTFWLYPTLDESRDQRLLATRLESHAAALVQATAGMQTRIYSLARHPGWREVQYADAIHPSAAGTRKLAEIMASRELAPMLMQ